MGWLFDSGSETVTTVSDPWATMPPWLKDQLEAEGVIRADLLNEAQGVADYMSANPRQIEDMSTREQNALSEANAAKNQAAKQSADAYGLATSRSGDEMMDYYNANLDGSSYDPYQYDAGYDAMDYQSQYDPYAYDSGYQTSSFDSGYDPTTYENQYDAATYTADYDPTTYDAGYDQVQYDSGYQAPTSFDSGYQTPASFDSGYETTTYDAGYEASTFDSGYDPTAAESYTSTYGGDSFDDLAAKDLESQYTDDVVDATLANMQREADRNNLAAESQSAAVGGTTNTRSAVEQAVNNQLTGMNMAQVEAELRDDAFNTATQYEMELAAMMDASDQYGAQSDFDAAQFNETARRYGADMALQEQGMTDDALRYAAQMGLSEQELTDASNRYAAGMTLSEQEMMDDANRYAADTALTEQGMMDDANRYAADAAYRDQAATDASGQFAATTALQEQGMTDDAAYRAAQLGLTVQEYNDMAARYEEQQRINAQTLTDDSARYAADLGLTEQQMEEMSRQFAADAAYRDQAATDASNQYANDSYLAALGMTDASNQFAATTALQEQQFNDLAQRYGVENAQKMLEMGMGALEYGMGYDMTQAQVMDQLINADYARDMASADWKKAYGAEERAIDQAQSDADYYAPQDSLSWLSTILMGTAQPTPYGSTTTSTQPTPSPFAQAVGAGASALGVYNMIPGLSDRDAKHDITPFDDALGALRDVEAATYRYYDDAPTDITGDYTGLMAQDLEHIPGAVRMADDGYRRVDPYPVLSVVTQAVKELDKKTSYLEDLLVAEATKDVDRPEAGLDGGLH